MIGIIGAMDEEVEKLKEDMREPCIRKEAAWTFYQGELFGRDAVVVTGGVGKVNAAICAQVLVDRFDVDVLINTGVAGSLDPAIDIGDLVISTDVLHHDMDASAFGDPPGQVPRMDVLSFPADPELVRKAAEVSEKVNPDIHTFTGRIASGDQVIAAAEKKDRIAGEFHALCAEMEGAGVAQAAYINHIPFVIIRAVSDKADDSASMDYAVFEQQAIEHNVRLLGELLPEI